MASSGDFPISLEYLSYGENPSFDNFFRNSFMHYYLRNRDFGEIDNKLKQKIAVAKCDKIASTSKFLVGFDRVDKNVFYSFCAFTLDENRLFIHFVYVKKIVRGHGFFLESLKVLKDSASEYYYTMPIKFKFRSRFPEFTRRQF